MRPASAGRARPETTIKRLSYSTASDEPRWAMRGSSALTTPRSVRRAGYDAAPRSPVFAICVALDVLLVPAADRERAGRDVEGDHRAGPGVGPVADRDGCDEGGV